MSSFLLSSSFLVEHRSSTSASHLTLFLAVALTSCHVHVKCLSSSSAILVHVQVCRCLPLLRFSCGFHSRALLATCLSGLLSVRPIQPQALCLISSSTGCCPVCFQSSSLQILLGHQICRMFFKLLLINTCNFCFTPLVSFQVSKTMLPNHVLHIMHVLYM